MGSSEIVDSGRVSGQKSNFSQTCNLLSQYLKEKGSFGDLSLGINRNFDSPAVTPNSSMTMNLFPMIEKSGESQAMKNKKPMNLFPQPLNFNKFESANNSDSSVGKCEPEKAQMTIFYAGQVVVFDDLPADKAKEIMLLASKVNKTQSHNNNSFTTCAMVPPKPAESVPNLVASASNGVSNFGNTQIQERPHCQLPSQPIVSDLPIARRASLTRFLEKRKDRLTSKAPYTISDNHKQAASSKVEESKAWLGLGAQLPLKTEH